MTPLDGQLGRTRTRSSVLLVRHRCYQTCQDSCVEWQSLRLQVHRLKVLRPSHAKQGCGEGVSGSSETAVSHP